MAIVGAGGLAELYALGGLHPVGRASAVDERVGRIERALVCQYRAFRRIRLNGPSGTELAFVNAEQEVIFSSEGGTVTLSLGMDHPTRTDIVDFAVVAAKPCFDPCDSPVTNPLGGTENTRWAGFLRICRDGSPDRCVAVPFVECADVGGCT